MLLVLMVIVQPGIPVLAALDGASRYFQLGLEGTDWITSFQVAPPGSSWGNPYRDERTWGLDPYYYSNGTITAGTGKIAGGERQRFAYVIGGHDAGLGALASLDAYILTHDRKYLSIFNVYFDFFRRSQIPSTFSSTNATEVVKVAGQNITLYYGGYWAEQASVTAGPDGIYGTSDDHADLSAVYPAAEHGNPIALALIAYYRLTHDAGALLMLNHYGNWLVRLQTKSGAYAGAFPVTQYYEAAGWKPRMYETTESAWVLTELYRITGNRTYLDAAAAAGNYMLSRQFIASSDQQIEGALPYEWNKTKYTDSVSTNHAGFTLLAWTQLFKLTNDTRFLSAAKAYAAWLMRFQVTSPSTSWGNHTFANDPMAVGGFYYGYDTDKHEFGSRVKLALWSAAYAIPGLLLLGQVTHDERYIDSALLASDWLIQMRYPDSTPIPLQSLAIIKYVMTSWWGPFPQFYQPDMRQVEKKRIPEFVQKAHANPASIRNHNLTWFERTFNVNFDLIDYEMASRGGQYMKMVWSWWPDIGFEPRYGGDVAFGAFAIANYLTFKDKVNEAAMLLSEVQRLTGNQTTSLPENITNSYNRAIELLSQGNRDFGEGWYSIAVARITNSTTFARSALNQMNIFIPMEKLRSTQQTEAVAIVTLAILLVITNTYWYQKSRKAISNNNQRYP